MPAERVGRDSVEALLHGGRQRERTGIGGGLVGPRGRGHRGDEEELSPNRIELCIGVGPGFVVAGRIVRDESHHCTNPALELRSLEVPIPGLPVPARCDIGPGRPAIGRA